MIYARDLLARQKRMQSEAEGDARADGVETYSEVSARPDNEVRKPQKGLSIGQF